MDNYDDLPEGYSLLDFNEVLDEEDYESYLEEEEGRGDGRLSSRFPTR